MAKFTSGDITRLAHKMRRAKDDQEKPYTLLAGAGLSYSAGMPLAGTITRMIQKEYRDDVAAFKGTPAYDDYAACMSCLTIRERKRLLKPWLEKARTNWGSLALASLMKAGFVGHVLTFNFDSILARACGVTGLYPAAYDFAVTPANHIDFIDTPAIIYLHGQGAGMIMLNSAEETKRHAQKLKPFLRDTLDKFPMLVIGYSGNSDSVFPVLKETFNDMERLCWTGMGEEPEAHVKELLDKAKNTSSYLGNADADVFLIKLAQELKCFPPLLFSSPYQHLLYEVTDVVDYPEEAGSHDILKSLRQELEEKNDKKSNMKPAKPNLMAMTLAGQWDEIIKLGKPEDKANNDIYAWAFISKGNESLNKAKETGNPALYEKAIAKYTTAMKIKPDKPEALINWGAALGDLAELKSDPALYEAAIAKYREAVAIKQDNHEALNNWGSALGNLAKLKSDPALYEDAIEKYREAVEIKPDNHEALNNWGGALGKLAKLKGEPALYEEAFEKYRRAVAIKPDGFQALYNWGGALLDRWRMTGLDEDFVEAREVLEKARALNSDNVYNLACIEVLSGNVAACRAHLEHCRDKGSLPDKVHLMQDPDLEPVRKEDWFKALVGGMADSS